MSKDGWNSFRLQLFLTMEKNAAESPPHPSMIEEHTIIVIASIGVLALLCQAVAWWLKLPAILFLLLAGMTAGPLLGWVDPDALFGDLLFPFVSLSVAIILFEGSLTLKFEEIKGVENVVRRLVTGGVVLTWVITAIATHWIIGFSWQLSFLFGAIAVVTGPTVIVPMLRTVRPTARIANILRWEGIIIDPVGAVLAVLVFEFIVSGSGGNALGLTLLVFGETMLIGIVTGAAGGYCLGLILRRHLLPEYLHNITTLAFLFVLYSFSNLIATEAGLLTVTVMGIWLANMKGVNIDEILDFKESLSLLLISVLFIILAARVELDQFEALGWGALSIILVLQFVARPLKVIFSTLGTSVSWRERGLLAWIAPRGIVAAAVAALFALRLEDQGMAQAPLLVPLTFLAIIGTVVLQSATARLVAVMLGVAEPEPRGFLIVGANRVARAIGSALQEHDYHVLLTDTNWDNISTARLEGMKAFYGNPVSEYADRHLDLVGIGRLLALSPRDDVNALATLRYRGEFGQQGVFSLAAGQRKGETGIHKPAIGKFGKVLFGEDAGYSTLAGLIAEGAEIHSTPLTEKFDFDAMREEYGADTLPLFALTPRGHLRIFTVDSDFKPTTDWTVINLSRKHKAEEKAIKHDDSSAAQRPSQ